MILACPTCKTRFLVPDPALGKGRRVRCGKCRHEWHAEAPAPQVASAPAPAAPEVAPARAEAEPPRVALVAPPEPELARAAPRYPVPAVQKAKFPTRLQLGWGALAATIVLVVGGLAAARDTVLETWPRAGSLYALVGAGPEPLGAGLDFREVKPLRTADSIVIEGRIANVSAVPRAVPNLEIALQDAGRRPVQALGVVPERRELPPGEAIPFKAVFLQPSETATSYAVTFASGL